jgi:SpoVK/Ycf46/Vps4 family AAA+-type ATPase
VLSFLKSNQDLNPNKFDDLFIRMEDFQRALAIVHPSAKREGFATVPDVSWQDIGALKDVRNDLEWSILVSLLYHCLINFSSTLLNAQKTLNYSELALDLKESYYVAHPAAERHFLPKL